MAFVSEMRRFRQRYLVPCALFLLALGARMAAWVVLGGERVPWQYEYEEIARHLIGGQGYTFSFYKLAPPQSTSFIPPVYPLLVALSRWLRPADDLILIGLQVVVSSCIPLLIMALARRMGIDGHGAILAGLIGALYPPAIAYAVTISTATVEAAALLIGVLLLFRSVENRSTKAALGTVAAFAFAALSRAPWLIASLLAILWLVWRLRTRSFSLIRHLLVGFLVVYSPWLIWNFHAHGSLVLTSTNGGLNFWIGNNPRATGEYIFPTQLDRAFVEEVAALPEVERDRRFYQAGRAFIREHPARFVTLFLRKIGYFFFFRPHLGSNFQGISATLLVLAQCLFKAAWLLLLPFALIGLFHLPQHRRAAHLFGGALFLAQSMIAGLYFTGTRFRFPLDFFAILWAAIGLTWMFERWVAPRRVSRENLVLIGILFVALGHGLIYTFLMPPWQHYEEPSHFELAWILASTHQRPVYPAYDIPKRLEIGQSMIRHGFYDRIGPPPNPDDYREQPFPIGINVTGALPLYHAFVALPLALTQQQPIEVQLYAGRLVSLGMYLLTVLFAALTIRWLTPMGHVLRWAVPLAIALQPGFTELMTAINNDVGATLAFSFFLWSVVRLLHRGFSPGGLAVSVVATLVCLFTKPTVLIAAPLLILVILLLLLRRYSLRWSMVVAATLGLAALPIFFTWGDAAAWYRLTDQSTPPRVKIVQADGSYAFALISGPGEKPPRLAQRTFLVSDLRSLRGKTVTVGATVWSNKPLRGTLIEVRQGDNRQITVRDELEAEIGLTPQRITLPVVVRNDSFWIEVVLQGISADGPVTVYFDDVFLVPSTAAGADSANLLRNPSAEAGMPRIRPWVEQMFRRFPFLAHLSPGTFLAGLWDVNHLWMLRASWRNLMETFWAKFAWASVPLPAPWYSVLTWATWLGLLGGGWFAVQHFRSGRELPWGTRASLLVLGLAFAILWGSNLLRGYFSIWQAHVYIPVARYAYPAIIPTMLWLVVGWHALLPMPGSWRPVIYFWGLGLLDFEALHTLWKVFYG